MTSSRKPLLLLLLSFLMVMLWQAWVLDHMQKPGNAKTIAPPAASIAKPINIASPSPGTDQNITVVTDLFKVQINKRGGFVERVWLKEYPSSLQNTAPFTLFSFTDQHAFLAQSGFSGDKDLYFNSARSHYELTDGQETLRVTLEAKDQHGISYSKTFIFNRDQYHIVQASSVHNHSVKDWSGSHYSTFSGYHNTTLDNGKIPNAKEFNVDIDAPKPAYFTYNTYTGPAYYTPETPYVKFSFADMATKNLNKTVTTPNWIAVQQRYFIAAWIPGEGGDQTLSSSWQSGSIGKADNDFRQSFIFSSHGDTTAVKPGESLTKQSTLYAGPELTARLAPLAHGLDLTIDYGWLWFISDLLFHVLNFVHKYLGSWGWAIVVTTLLVKLVFYKMSEASYRAMALQRKLKPRLDAIQERFADDPDKKNQATMELYQKENINPLNGCLPTLLQIPFFLALYYVLIESIQLRLASFLWIPDLSSKDPYYILPVLLIMSMLLMQRLSPKQSDPVQERTMQGVQLMMGAMFSQFPAGLVLYWLTNNFLSFVQQYYVMHKYNAFE